MKKIIYITLLACCLTISVEGQNTLNSMLESIERNNTQLKALRELSTAEKLENTTANNLVNPEVEVIYKPSARGMAGETGIEATQSFDFPTAYKHRGQVIGMKNERVDLAYEQSRRQVLSEARILAVEYIHQTKLLKVVEERLQYAQDLHAGYEKLFVEGDINVLERNKTKLNLLEAEKYVQLCRVDLNTMRTELERMNGDMPLPSYPQEYYEYPIPLEFEDWFARVKYNIPTLQIGDKNMEMSRKEEQLTRSLNLPKLSAGYVGDLMKNESRHGFLVSVSVPLWEGKNTVKSKQAQTLAMQYEKEDAELQFKNGLRASYEKAQKLAALLKEYSEIVDNSNNFLLLKKAFDMGELSLIQYLQELIIYHSAVDDYLSTQRDYYLTVSNLEQWEN